MNLREAIQTGAAKVAGRCRYEYITKRDDGEYEACALGAAYLGCHPEMTPEQAFESQDIIDGWVGDMDEQIRGTDSYDALRPSFTGTVFRRNDLLENGSWDELFAEYERVRYDNRPLTEIEVCNDTGDDDESH